MNKNVIISGYKTFKTEMTFKSKKKKKGLFKKLIEKFQKLQK